MLSGISACLRVGGAICPFFCNSRCCCLCLFRFRISQVKALHIMFATLFCLSHIGTPEESKTPSCSRLVSS